MSGDLPTGWTYAEVGSLLEFKYGKALPDRERSGHGFPVYGSNGTVGCHSPPLTSSTTLVVGRKGSVGQVHFSPGACSPIDTTYYIDETPGEQFRFWWYRLRDFKLAGLNKSTAIPGLSRVDVYKLEVGLPPLAEQKRIADKLDAVLARVDAVNDRLARVAPLLKRFRQSVLAAAISGRLTEGWHGARELSNEPTDDLPSGWRRMKFDEVCREITVGFVGKMADQYVDSGIPFLRSMNVRAFRFDPKGLQFITPNFHKQIFKSTLRPGDLAIVRSGAPGVCCVVPSDLTEANCSDLVIARPGPQLLATYGCIFMNSTFGASHVAANVVGVAQAHFNVGSMKLTQLPLPPVNEQAEIVRRVELLFAYADRLETRLQAAQTATQRLTPALLAKAFRGELVPQDPNDEPAQALLARLRAAKAVAAPTTGAKRGRRVAAAR